MPKRSAKRHLEYKKAFIAYIDILGFKELIASRTANEISRTLRIFKKHGDPANRLGLSDPPAFEYVVNFSDLCIVAIPFEDNVGKMRGAASNLIWRLLYAQASLISRYSIFVRGGVTVGEIERSYGQLFGAGIVSAYELESKAVYPRILVDPAFVEEARTNPALWWSGSRPSDVDSIDDLLARGAGEDIPYIDYLRHITVLLTGHSYGAIR